MKKIVLMIVSALFAVAVLAGCGGSSNAYKAGTYTATVEGYGGDVIVEVTFDEESILSVEVVDHNETEKVAGPAIPVVTEAIVKEQTADVDAYASATVTSEAIKDAVKDCIGQAENK